MMRPLVIIACLWSAHPACAALSCMWARDKTLHLAKAAIAAAASGDTINVHAGHLRRREHPDRPSRSRSSAAVIPFSMASSRARSSRSPRRTSRSAASRSSTADAPAPRISPASASMRAGTSRSPTTNCSTAISASTSPKAHDCRGAAQRHRGQAGQGTQQRQRHPSLELRGHPHRGQPDHRAPRRHLSRVRRALGSRGQHRGRKPPLRAALHELAQQPLSQEPLQPERRGRGRDVLAACRDDRQCVSSTAGAARLTACSSRISATAEIRGNTFHHNSTAIYSQGATRTTFEDNQFRENGWALRILSNGDRQHLSENNFSRNSFDVGTNGELAHHVFAGNYWDRYEGYDLKRDGIGDVPFRPVSLYAMLAERVPLPLPAAQHHGPSARPCREGLSFHHSGQRHRLHADDAPAHAVSFHRTSQHPTTNTMNTSKLTKHPVRRRSLHPRHPVWRAVRRQPRHHPLPSTPAAGQSAVQDDHRRRTSSKSPPAARITPRS